MNTREYNAKYYTATRNRIILREEELSPSAIIALIECLEQEPAHHADKRLPHLRALHKALVGE